MRAEEAAHGLPLSLLLSCFKSDRIKSDQIKAHRLIPNSCRRMRDCLQPLPGPARSSLVLPLVRKEKRENKSKNTLPLNLPLNPKLTGSLDIPLSSPRSRSHLATATAYRHRLHRSHRSTLRRFFTLHSSLFILHVFACVLP